VNATQLLRTLILASALSAMAGEARADWMFTPFVGSGFGTETSQLIVDTGAAHSKLTFGGSAALLSRGIFGAEADLGYTPHFFESGSKGTTLAGSDALTFSGSAIAAVPMSVTRESLRPYVVGGIGVIHSEATDLLGLFTFHENDLGMNIGGGAIGLISPRTGFRFEIRQFRTLKNGTNSLTSTETARLSFWRATLGVVIRFAK
jgi:hypothetical protein